MNNQVQQVQVRAVLPLEGSYALFLGNAEKTFVIYIDEQVGGAISMFMRGAKKDRPLTHDLMATLLMAFGAKVERVVINDMNGSVFYARLILAAENQLHNRKLIELDARPSDSIALAIQQGCPVYVADGVWEAVEDVSQALAQIESKTLEENQAAEAAAGGDAEFEGLFDLDDDDDDEDDDDDYDDDDDFSEFDDSDEDDAEDDDFELEEPDDDDDDGDEDGPDRRR